ncbi:MAG: chemotaxis response regulator protein-glutamate methylesterase [Planctomycetaceae bacterium]|nr:chemotaxis response regulator protein-glutamate methylesterase [Planctomycetaceae bacterium]
MIVEDSAVVRVLLEHIVNSDPRLQVASSVARAEEAFDVLERASVDIITMDIELPGVDGYEATKRIMATHPTPIVVVSAHVDANQLTSSMNALRAGALSVIEKPVGMTHSAYAQVTSGLCDQLVSMSQVKVIRQRRLQAAASEPPDVRQEAVVRASSQKGEYQTLGLVASTGGPNALVQVLRALDQYFPLPIFLVQHITDCFLEGFVSWVADETGRDVQIFGSGEEIVGGRVYLAPPGKQLEVTRESARLTQRPAGQQRSGTVLLQSMARSFKSEAIGVVLTGMGQDGAVGLKELHDSGGFTLAESEETAVVYGMPKVAVELGAVCESLPLDRIGERIVELMPARSPVT